MKKWFNLENLIYLTIFLLPSYLIKFDFFDVPTNVLEVLIVVAFVWAILKRSFRKFLNLRFRIAIGLILTGLIISTLINENYAAGFGIIKGWFILPIMLAIVAKNVVPQEKIKNIYGLLYFSALGVAIISLGYYFVCDVETRHCLGSTYDGRLQGIFNSPNYLAMYLAPALVIGAGFFQGRQKERINYLFYYVINYVIILAAFYLTYSYAAWAAAGASILIAVFAKNSGKIKPKHAAVAFGLVILVALSQWNSQKFQDLRSVAERSSFRSRMMIWRAAEKITSNHWTLGIGPGNFQAKYLEYQKYFPSYLEWAVPHPHNLYLSFWLYSGVIGLTGFVALLYFWLKEISKKEKDMLWRVSLGIMIYILIHGLADTTYFKNDLAGVFWLNLIVLL